MALQPDTPEKIEPLSVPKVEEEIFPTATKLEEWAAKLRDLANRDKTNLAEENKFPQPDPTEG